MKGVLIKLNLSSFKVETFGPTFVIDGVECIASDKPWDCTRQKLVKALDIWDENLQVEREALIGKLILTLNLLPSY